MKKTIPALLLACVLFACKKETNTDGSTPASASKVPVKFSVQNFLVSQQNMSMNGRVATDSSLSGLQTLVYTAFASSGSMVSHMTQISWVHPDFGIITDSLAPGTYTVVIGASPNDVRDNYINGFANANFQANPNDNSLDDLFYKKIQVTVSENGNPPTIDLTLDRIVGLLKVDLKDALPTSDPNGAVTVDVKNIPTIYEFKSDLAKSNFPSTRIYNRTSQTTWEMFIFGSTAPLEVVLGWKDKVTGAAQTKTIQNVLVSANKKTLITGYLYGVPQNIGGSDYLVRANQNWSTDSTVININ